MNKVWNFMLEVLRTQPKWLSVFLLGMWSVNIVFDTIGHFWTLLVIDWIFAIANLYALTYKR